MLVPLSLPDDIRQWYPHVVPQQTDPIQTDALPAIPDGGPYAAYRRAANTFPLECRQSGETCISFAGDSLILRVAKTIRALELTGIAIILVRSNSRL